MKRLINFIKNLLGRNLEPVMTIYPKGAVLPYDESTIEDVEIL